MEGEFPRLLHQGSSHTLCKLKSSGGIARVCLLFWCVFSRKVECRDSSLTLNIRKNKKQNTKQNSLTRVFSNTLAQRVELRVPAQTVTRTRPKPCSITSAHAMDLVPAIRRQRPNQVDRRVVSPPLSTPPLPPLPLRRMQRFLRERVADVTASAAPLTSRCVREARAPCASAREEWASKNTQYAPHTPRALTEAYTETYRAAGDLSSRTPRADCDLGNISVVKGAGEQTNKPDYGVLKSKVTWLDRICCGFGH